MLNTANIEGSNIAGPVLALPAAPGHVQHRDKEPKHEVESKVSNQKVIVRFTIVDWVQFDYISFLVLHYLTEAVEEASLDSYDQLVNWVDDEN